jgi:hypothetical protein
VPRRARREIIAPMRGKLGPLSAFATGVGLSLAASASAQVQPQPPEAKTADHPPATCTTSACEMRCCARCGCGAAPTVSLSVVGLRAAFTNVNTETVSDGAVGVGIAGMAESYALDGATHGAASFMLGGGGAGFEGTLAGIIDIGHRFNVTEDHGPFGRIGLDGRLQGNDLHYFSMFELPRVTLGWQYLKGNTAIEGGLRGGAILAGQYHPAEDGRRRLNGFEWGAFGAAQIDFLRFDVSLMRIEARKTLNGTPVDVVRGSLCGVQGKFGVCLDAMVLRGDADMRANNGGVRDTATQYIGLMFGAGEW